MEDSLPTNVPMPDSNVQRAVRVWAVSELQGTLLTHLESLGLQERQEKAIKSMVKRDLWDWYYRTGTLIVDLGEGILHYQAEGWGPQTTAEMEKSLTTILKAVKDGSIKNRK